MIITIDYIGIKNLKNPFVFLKNNINAFFYDFLKHIEEKKPLWDLVKFDKDSETRKDRLFIFYITLALIILAFVGRFYFYKYDTFVFSDLWISNLKRIIAIDNQTWFDTEIVTSGEKGMANLYGKITDVSPEVALESLAIIESVLIGLVLFWTIRQITLSETFAPFVAFSSFVFLYAISPIEIHYLLQSVPVLLALSLALPAMVYTLRPDILKFKKISYFTILTLCFIAIGLIDLFTLFILIPPFYAITIWFIKRKHFVFSLISLLAYILGVAVIMGVYYFYCLHYQNDFVIFIQSHLISVSSFTYMPNIVIPFSELLTIYQYISVFGIVVLPILIWYKKEKWRASFIFLLYFNVLVFMSLQNNPWVDSDLLRYALAVFIPVLFGITTAVIIRLLLAFYKKISDYKYILFPALSLAMLFSILYYQKDVVKSAKVSDETPRIVLDIYDKVTHSHFPYTYAVVNDNIAQTISTNKHFFINYSDFLYSYPESDSIYHENRKKPKFFIENPDLVIPKSVLVFVYNHDNPEKNNHFAEQSQMEQILMEQIEMLKNRGREIELFYDSEYVRVYEIINEPKSSKIDDLIF